MIIPTMTMTAASRPDRRPVLSTLQPPAVDRHHPPSGSLLVRPDRRAAPRKKRAFVLIDDDPVFCARFVEAAKRYGIEVDYFTSLLELGSIGCLANYDAAIIDYDLGQVNGVEVAEYVPTFFGDMPLILISGRPRWSGVDKPWPACIACFVEKTFGIDAIVTAAIATRHAWLNGRRLASPSGV